MKTVEISISHQAFKVFSSACTAKLKHKMKCDCMYCLDFGCAVGVSVDGYYAISCPRCDAGKKKADEFKAAKISRIHNDSSKWVLT